MHINITSSTRKHPHPADMLIDCANLPNPHEVPALRPRDGRDRTVKDWLTAQQGVNEFIQQYLVRIINHDGTITAYRDGHFIGYIIDYENIGMI